jgi:hypothetical protein
MVVKRNQRRLYEDLELFFRRAAIVADAEHWDRVQTLSQGHGRIARWTLERREGLCGERSWPGAAQVMRRTCERTIVVTGESSCEVTSGMSDLTPTHAGAAHLACLWRGHWTSDNRDQYVRDGTLGEEGGPAHTGSTAHALATWRNGIRTRAPRGLAHECGCRACLCRIGTACPRSCCGRPIWDLYLTLHDPRS